MTYAIIGAATVAVVLIAWITLRMFSRVSKQAGAGEATTDRTEAELRKVEDANLAREQAKDDMKRDGITADDGFRRD